MKIEKYLGWSEIESFSERADIVILEKIIYFIASPYFLKAKSLVALLLQCRWICRGWAASPAAGSPVNPLHFLLPLLISYFPCCKIISHNLADNLKFWQKSENSVFIKKLRQLNSTLYLSQVTPTDTSLVTSGKTRRTNKNTNCVCVPGSVVSWLLFFCTTASCTSSHTTLRRRQVQVQRLVALPHEQFRRMTTVMNMQVMISTGPTHLNQRKTQTLHLYGVHQHQQWELSS